MQSRVEYRRDRSRYQKQIRAQKDGYTVVSQGGHTQARPDSDAIDGAQSQEAHRVDEHGESRHEQGLDESLPRGAAIAIAILHHVRQAHDRRGNRPDEQPSQISKRRAQGGQEGI